MNNAMLTVTKLNKRFGGLQVTRDVSLQVRRNEFHALIGPNGAGKTTLINQLHGTFFADSGSVQLDTVDITRAPVHRRALLGMARSFQISSVVPEFTALQNVALAVQAVAGHSFRFWRAFDDDLSLTLPAFEALKLAGLETRARTKAINLSHGERRQLEIAIALAMGPKLLMLDEPMAGMGQNESSKLVELLMRIKGKYTILMVEHDMDAVFALADRLSVLVSGSVLISDQPEVVRANEAVQAAYLGHQQ